MGIDDSIPGAGSVSSAEAEPLPPDYDEVEIKIEVEPEPGRPPIEKGSRIGKYLLEEPIGLGGMAEVWRARLQSQDYDRRYAIKFMLDSLGANAKFRRMFINEAQVARNVAEHANVVSILDADEVPADGHPALAGRHYLVMEWVKGADLARFIGAVARRGGTIRQKIALFIVGEVLKGLANIHGARDEHSRIINLVHRDISPHNVLLNYTGGVKISDFGVAKMDSMPTTRNVRGKFSYFAPEVVLGRTQDHRSDQFAVGVILWEMLAGRKLFRGRTDAEVLHRVSICDIPPIGREIDGELKKVLDTMLAAKPRHRFESCNDALSAVFKLPGYSPDARELAEMLLYLFPDPEQRLPTPTEAPKVLAQPSGPIDLDLGYPTPMDALSSFELMNLDDGSILPVWPAQLGRHPYEHLSPNGWVRAWKELGFDRDDEVAPQVHTAPGVGRTGDA